MPRRERPSFRPRKAAGAAGPWRPDRTDRTRKPYAVNSLTPGYNRSGGLPGEAARGEMKYEIILSENKGHVLASLQVQADHIQDAIEVARELCAAHHACDQIEIRLGAKRVFRETHRGRARP